MLGGGWAAAMRWEHSHTAWQPRTYCILLAVVVHSVPASSFTVCFFITVDTRAVESLLLVSWMSSFKTLQLCLRPRLAPSQSIRFLNSHSSPEVAAKHSHPGAFQPLLPFDPAGLWELPGVTVNCPVNNSRDYITLLVNCGFNREWKEGVDLDRGGYWPWHVIIKCVLLRAFTWAGGMRTFVFWPLGTDKTTSLSHLEARNLLKSGFKLLFDCM